MTGPRSTRTLINCLDEIVDLDEYNLAVLASMEEARAQDARAILQRVTSAPMPPSQTCQPPFAHRSLFFVCDRCGKLVDTPEEQRAWRQRWIDEERGGVIEARLPCKRCGQQYRWPWPGNPDGMCPRCIDGSRSWDEVQRRADERRRDARLSFFAAKYGVRWTPHCGDRDCDGTCADPLCVLPDEVVQQLRMAAGAPRPSKRMRKRPIGERALRACEKILGVSPPPELLALWAVMLVMLGIAVRGLLGALGVLARWP